MPLDPEIVPILRRMEAAGIGREETLDQMRGVGTPLAQLSCDLPPVARAKDIWI